MGYFCVKKVKNKLYASSFKTNALVEIVNENIANYITRFEKEDNKGSLHRVIISYSDELFFIPQIAKYISEYNLSTREMTYYNFNENDNKLIMCSNAILYKDYIYIFPRYLNQGLLIFDIGEKNVRIEEKWKNELLQVGLNVNQEFDTFSTVFDGKYFWSVSLETNLLIRYEPNSCKIETFALGDNKLRNIEIGENTLWMTCIKQANIVCFDMDTLSFKVYNGTSDKKEYHRIICNSGKVLVLPVKGYEIEEVKNGRIEQIIKTSILNGEVKYCFGESYCSDKKIYFLPLLDNNLKILDLETNQLIVKSFDESELESRMKWSSAKSAGFIVEDSEFNLSNVIWGLKNEQC